ncbi:unnamed protein product (macronuclear) [Paramecium tetraurelia]|uniref:Uncharacterized protein n=1 Tax=Paramecium tetraurelia TaxID=5888 RepID=A0DDW2_PARTE|nr:uncharacterized protein GSPATT00016070001 [Paramecium tetraurelia]CAK81229.1 unnamed protein product [Paramecium tetraurelia]|eukprot:XP_001448626.1 hypothetical protein (macronuclear) [Paramecium tetraurelia strain d4-2]
MNQKVKIECVTQGFQISNEMKFDIMDFYHKSLHQEHYAHKTDYIRHNLEEKYGRCFSIIMYQIGAFVSHSFLHADDFLLELRSPEHHILAYMLPPSFSPPPLIPEPKVIPFSRTTTQQLHVSKYYQPYNSGYYRY